MRTAAATGWRCCRAVAHWGREGGLRMPVKCVCGLESRERAWRFGAPPAGGIKTGRLARDLPRRPRRIFRNSSRHALHTFRPERATARRTPSARALMDIPTPTRTLRALGAPDIRGEIASEPCRVAKSDKLPNARCVTDA